MKKMPRTRKKSGAYQINVLAPKLWRTIRLSGLKNCCKLNVTTYRLTSSSAWWNWEVEW